MHTYTIKSKQTRIFKKLKLKNWVGIDHCYKVRKQGIANILTWDSFKSLIPTFGKQSLIKLTYCYGQKVGIKLLKISHVRILAIPCFLTFCSSDQFLLSF